jgi:hypothetical protein
MQISKSPIISGYDDHDRPSHWDSYEYGNAVCKKYGGVNPDSDRIVIVFTFFCPVSANRDNSCELNSKQWRYTLHTILNDIVCK